MSAFLGWVVALVLGSPVAGGTEGAVAADHELASAAGVEVLRAGGNAVDAAVAASLAASVVQPAGSGMGGGGFAVVRTSAGVVALDFREVAPSGASPAWYLQADGTVARSASRYGALAVAVPGQSRGLARLVRDHGRLDLAAVAAPAVRLAEEGFPVGPHLAEVLGGIRLREVQALFTRDGRVVRAGDPLRRPAHAALLRAWAASGGEDLHTGTGAARIAAAVPSIPAADLAAYAPRALAPVSATYRGWTLWTMPLPSAGGPLLALMLAVLEDRDLAALDAGGPEWAHLVVEVLKHAFAIRAAELGDVALPPEALLAPARVAAIRGALDPARTLPRDAYGPAARPPGDDGTQHVSAVDAEGNAAAITTTINGPFGSGVVVEELDLILNDEMDDFSIAPGIPDQFGLVGSEANAVRPGRRPLSAMTPLILESPTGAVYAVGGSGGARILSAVLQVVLRMVDQGERSPVTAPRIHHQWRPDRLEVESGILLPTREGLVARGHDVVVRDSSTAVQWVGLEGGRLVGEADPRKGGAVAVSGFRGRETGVAGGVSAGSGSSRGGETASSSLSTLTALSAAAEAASGGSALAAASSLGPPMRALLHLDTPTQMARRGLGFDAGLPLRAGLPLLEAGGTNLAVEVLWSPPGADPVATAFGLLDLLERELARLDDRVVLARSPEEAAAAARAGKVAVVLASEGAEAFAADPTALGRLYGRGLRMVGLTWNHDNPYAGACCDGAGGGLTERGRALVRTLQDLGVLVDLSHASPRTALDVCAEARAPVVASHSNTQEVFVHPRNLPAPVLACVAATGGVVGVNLHGEFLGSPATVDAAADHVLALVRALGPEHVAVGSDFDGASGLPAGLGHAGELDALWAALRARGLDEAALEQVRGESFRRAWTAAWSARAPRSSAEVGPSP